MSGSVTGFVHGETTVQTYNQHRKSECPSNHVSFDDTVQLWKPFIQVLDALEVVMLARHTNYFLILSFIKMIRHYSSYLGWVLEGAIEEQLRDEVRRGNSSLLLVDEHLRQSKVSNGLCPLSV